MKGPTGLALVLSPKAPKGLSAKEPDGDEPTDESAADAGSEKQYARVAAEAIGDGDYDTAADALVSMVKACLQTYGGEK